MSGLLALLDDVAGIAKVAAASVDDIAGQATRAGVKAAGAVIDDAAVAPKYVQGFDAKRELPIVGRIALGSIRNKLLVLLPAALILSAFAPWAIIPLLMLGGCYLCFEGAEKVWHLFRPHAPYADGKAAPADDLTPVRLEAEKVAGAVKTDFILSAEIMTIALATLPAQGVLMQAAALALVGIGITALVYGGVALIVKADDAGLWLARRAQSRMMRALGRRLVQVMPGFLLGLTIVGTAAMIWVGGSIVVHGLETFGLSTIGHWIEWQANTAAEYLQKMPGVVHWTVTAFFDGVFGLLLGLLLIPVVTWVIDPMIAAVSGGKAH
ncbi:DUF808 domain-containing protein [Phaeovulum sp.]|uniref:DUF808 domain-containing protein n=1 Tax=Phaeovulum sp. TaxID=2934796 RepID=UPI0039E61E44